MVVDWNKISEKQKKEISKDKPIFICGPRDISEKRILQLTKQLTKPPSPELGRGRSGVVVPALLWGCLKDEYIPEMKGEQFRSLNVDKLNKALREIPDQVRNDIIIFHYYQRDWIYILKELDFKAIILINGSWHRMIHVRPEFWEIVNKKTPYKLVSAFVNEEEAKKKFSIFNSQFSNKKFKNLKLKIKNSKKDLFTIEQLMQISLDAASHSWDWVFQTGCALAKENNKGYEFLLSSHNTVVPYESYSSHFGSVREKNFSPPNDANHYDTNHAEVELLIKAGDQKIDLDGTTLFINLLPCPSCAKMISRTKIKEIAYKHDHSDGYAFKLLTQSGKIVRRII